MAAKFRLTRCQDLIPTRFIIACMIFFSILFSYMLRGNMSISIMSMTTASKADTKSNETITRLPDYGPRYNWPAFEQGILLGSYFYGYTISNFPSGYLAEIVGARLLLGLSAAICAILSLLTPVLAPSFWLSFTSRFFIGFFGGFVFPVGHSLIAKWAPPSEKTKFMSSMSGGSLGTAISWPMCGMIIEVLGWPYVFYITGGLSLAFSGLWFIMVFDTPTKHPRISQKERDYIDGEVVGVSASAKLVPPYLSIAKSIPFWSLLLLHYGNVWGVYFILTGAPKFMNEVLGFEIGKTGFLAMLPNLCRFITNILFGFVGDYVRNKKWFSTTCTRKLFCITSHIVPGLFLIGLNYVNTEPYYCVAFMALSLAFNGSVVLTSMQNSQDLSPNYAATIYGLINAFGTTAGFITPLVVAYFTQDNNTIKEWEMIFIIGGIAYILPAVIYMVFGSGDCQTWNERLPVKINENSDVPATTTTTVPTLTILAVDMGQTTTTTN